MLPGHLLRRILYPRWFDQWLTRGSGLVDYVPVGLRSVEHSAWLVNGTATRDVTALHFPLAYNPIVLGIVVDDRDVHMLQGVPRLEIRSPQGHLRAVLRLASGKEAFRSGDTRLHLLTVKSASIHQPDAFRRWLILSMRFIINRRSGKYFGTLPFSLHLQYAALFSFPRRVMLAIPGGDGAETMFPIDLHGQSGGHVFFGIRHSNRAVAALQVNARLVLGSVPFERYEAIYQLGKFRPAGQSADNVARSLTPVFGIKVPDFLLDLMEVEVHSHEDIGSQRLFVGAVRNRATVSSLPALHHVHLLGFLADYETRPQR